MFYLSFVFFLFILDNLVLYMNEFLPIFSTSNKTVIHFFSNSIYLAICLSYRLVFIAYNERTISKKEGALWAVLLIGELTVTIFSSYPVGKILTIVILNGSAVSVFLSGMYRIKKHGPFPVSQASPRMTFWFVTSGFLLELMNAVETVLHYRGYDLFEDRIISIELIGILFVSTAIAYIIRALSSRSYLPEHADTTEEFDSPDYLEKFSEAYSLTQRERDIFGFIIRGYTNEQISKEACIAQGTVKSHTHNIYQKLDVSNRIQLLARLREFNKAR
ncbi:MAG: response regulator transcription factor [Oscillospiraceae bacterium]|nr:response regulator transcription factor [Oscillospiraceae bacterium]